MPKSETQIPKIYNWQFLGGYVNTAQGDVPNCCYIRSLLLSGGCFASSQINSSNELDDSRKMGYGGRLVLFLKHIRDRIGHKLPLLKRCAKWIGSGINGSEGSIAMRLTPNWGFRLSFLPFKFSVCQQNIEDCKMDGLDQRFMPHQNMSLVDHVMMAHSWYIYAWYINLKCSVQYWQRTSLVSTLKICRLSVSEK